MCCVIAVYDKGSGGCCVAVGGSTDTTTSGLNYNNPLCRSFIALVFPQTNVAHRNHGSDV